MTAPAGGIFWKARIFEEFGVAMEPALTFAPAGHVTTPLGFELDPAFGMGASPHVQSEMNLALTPAITMRGGQNEFESAFTLTLGMGGYCNHQDTDFGLTFTLGVGMTGAEKYSRAVGLAFTPTVGMDAAAPPHATTVGAGVQGVYGNSASYSHTIAGDAVIVFVAHRNTGTVPAISGVTVGGQSATLLAGTQWYAAVGNHWNMYAYGLEDPPTGPCTISVTLDGQTTLSVNSLAFQGVSSIGTPTTAGGVGGNADMTVSSSSSQTIAHCFTGAGWDAPVLDYNKTSRWNSQNEPALLIGGAAGAASVNFTGTTSTRWYGIAVPMNLA